MCRRSSRNLCLQKEKRRSIKLSKEKLYTKRLVCSFFFFSLNLWNCLIVQLGEGIMSSQRALWAWRVESFWLCPQTSLPSWQVSLETMEIGHGESKTSGSAHKWACQVSKWAWKAQEMGMESQKPLALPTNERVKSASELRRSRNWAWRIKSACIAQGSLIL